MSLFEKVVDAIGIILIFGLMYAFLLIVCAFEKACY